MILVLLPPSSSALQVAMAFSVQAMHIERVRHRERGVHVPEVLRVHSSQLVELRKLKMRDRVAHMCHVHAHVSIRASLSCAIHEFRQ